jgi:hypothetical protein
MAPRFRPAPTCVCLLVYSFLAEYHHVSVVLQRQLAAWSRLATHKSASGTTVSNESKELMALDLDHVLSRLATSIQPQGILFVLQEHDQRLEDLRQRCEALARELLTKLKTFKGKKGDGKWKIMVKALRGTFSEAEIDFIDKRIADMRQEIGLHILVNLKYVKPVRSRSKVVRCRAF